MRENARDCKESSSARKKRGSKLGLVAPRPPPQLLGAPLAGGGKREEIISWIAGHFRWFLDLEPPPLSRQASPWPKIIWPKLSVTPRKPLRMEKRAMPICS